MAIDDLQADLKKTLGALPSPHATTTELSDHLRYQLWPTLERIVEEMAEQDDAIVELHEGDGEFVTAETADLLAAPIALALRFAEALERGDNVSAEDIKDAREVCKAATDALTEITAGDPDPDADETEE